MHEQTLGKLTETIRLAVVTLVVLRKVVSCQDDAHREEGDQERGRGHMGQNILVNAFAWSPAKKDHTNRRDIYLVGNSIVAIKDNPAAIYPKPQ